MSTNLNDNVNCKVETEWTAKDVENHFREAILTLKKLPPVLQRGYFNSWPDVIYSPNEIIFQEKRPMRLQAAPGAITRLDQTFEWVHWLEVEERKLIWSEPPVLDGDPFVGSLVAIDLPLGGSGCLLALRLQVV